MITTEDNATGPKGIHARIQFALWSMGYLLVALSIYAENTKHGNPIFLFGTDNMGWLNGIQEGNHLRETLLLLFTHLLPRLFDDNWTSYLVLMCLVFWLNGCLANLVCQALAHHYGLREGYKASVRSLAGGAAGLLVVSYNAGAPLAVNAFVYPLNCFFLLLTLLAFMTYLRTTKLWYWAVLLITYALAAKSSSYSWLFPLVLLAIEASSGLARPVRRYWLTAPLRYIPLAVISIHEISFERNPGIEGQFDVLGLFSLDVITSYLAHLGAAASLFVTAADFRVVTADFSIQTGPALAVALVLLITCAGYVHALRWKAPSSALPFILFVLWGVCSFLPLLKGASGQVAAIHRSYYNILGLSLLTGTMLGLGLWLLCRRFTPLSRGITCASAAVIIVVAVMAARPSVAQGLRLAVGRPLATFPGCVQAPRCVDRERAPSRTQGDDRLTACGDAAHLKLRGADLSGRDLHQLRLIGASIRGTKLDKADLAGSCAALVRIEDSNFDSASLARADLTSATLTRVSLNRANLDGASFRGSYNRWVQARKASMKDANMHITEWFECDFSGAEMDRINLSSSFLDKCKLTGADLRGANLEATMVVRCDLSKADLRKAQLMGGKFPNSDLSGADLRGAVLVDADLTGTSLAGARLAGSDTRGALVQGAIVCQQDAAHLRGTKGTPKLVPCPGEQTGASPGPPREVKGK